MKQISNSDFATIVDCLSDYVSTPDNGSLRAFNRRRKARLLLRKMRKSNEDGRADNRREQRCKD